MASQIEKLRASFEKMNTTQKKAFIDKLKLKLQGNANEKYSIFLNECVKKYKAEVEGESSIKTLDDLFDDGLPTGDYNIAEPADRLIAYLIDVALVYVTSYWLMPLGTPIMIFLANKDLKILFLKLSFIIYVVTLIIGFSLPFLNVFIDFDIQTELELEIMVPLYFCIHIIFAFIISIKYWKKGTSYGKSRRGLIVIKKETGEKLTVGYMFLRQTIGKFISGLVFSLGFIWILIDKDKQAWHDKLVSSIVVKK